MDPFDGPEPFLRLLPWRTNDGRLIPSGGRFFFGFGGNAIGILGLFDLMEQQGCDWRSCFNCPAHHELKDCPDLRALPAVS